MGAINNTTGGSYPKANQMIFCGAASFSHVDDEEDLWPPKARAWKKKQSSSNKNPYSSRGLDKFSEVMSELEAKREKIMASAAGSDKVSMVRFIYTNSDDWIPIVVRLQDNHPSNEVAARKSTKKPQPAVAPLPRPEQSSSSSDSEAVKETEAAEPERKLNKKKSYSLVGEECLRRWRLNYNWLVVLMVILVCMAMFGRVFAICCTSIWWYLAPTFKGTEANENRRQKQRQRFIKKKEYSKVLSNNRPLTQLKKTQELNWRTKG